MEGLRRDQECDAGESTEVERVIAFVMKAIKNDVRRIAEAVVLKRDDELLGRGEFGLRDKMLRMACHVLEATVNDRKKGGIKAPARSVPTATKTPASSSGEARRS
jgi:hypothetical protein